MTKIKPRTVDTAKLAWARVGFCAAGYIPGKYSTTQLHPQPSFDFEPSS